MVNESHKLQPAFDDLNDNDYWGEWLNEKLPSRTDFRKWECFGIKNGNIPLVAWSYHGYRGSLSHWNMCLEAEISIAAIGNWQVRTTLTYLLSLFFLRNGYNRLTALIYPDNQQAVRLVELAGFTLEGTIRKPSHSILQYSLLRTEWELGKWVL